MLFEIPHKRTLLFTAISTMSLLPLSGMTLAQDDPQIEEVVVTGSFIRRSEGFTQASSVLQFTAEDLEAEGTLNLGEVVQQMSFVNGSASAIHALPACAPCAYSQRNVCDRRSGNPVAQAYLRRALSPGSQTLPLRYW